MTQQKGFAHIFVILILLIGIIGGVYLVKHPQIFKPKAFENGEVTFMDNGKRSFPNNTTDNIFIYLQIKSPSWEAESESDQYTTSLRVSLDKNKLEPDSKCSFIADEDQRDIIQRANKSKDFMGLLAEKLYKSGYAPLESLQEYFLDITPKDLGGIYPNSSQQNLKVQIDKSTLSRTIREIEADTGEPESNCQEVTLDKPTDTVYLSWVLPKKDGENTIYVRFFSNKGNTKDILGNVTYRDNGELSPAVPAILVGGQALVTTLVDALRKIPGTAAFNAAAVFITRVQTAGEQIITLSQAKQLGFDFNLSPNDDGTLNFSYDPEQLRKLDISLEFFPDPDPLTGEPRLQINPKAALTDQEDMLQGSLDIVAGEIGGRIIGNLINRGVTKAVQTQAFKTVTSKVKIDLTDFKNTIKQKVTNRFTFRKQAAFTEQEIKDELIVEGYPRQEVDQAVQQERLELVGSTHSKLARDSTTALRFGESFLGGGAGEFEALSRLYKVDPDNVARPIELIREGDKVVGYKMEYIEGITVAEYKKKYGEIPADIKDQIISALQTFHKNNLAHGDPNLNNVIITIEGKVKFIDPVAYTEFKPEYATFDLDVVERLLH